MAKLNGTLELLDLSEYLSGLISREGSSGVVLWNPIENPILWLIKFSKFVLFNYASHEIKGYVFDLQRFTENNEKY